MARPPNKRMSFNLGCVRHACRFVGLVWKDYVADNGNLSAAAVSFFVFLSLIPMLLLAIAIGGFLLGSPGRAEHIVLEAINSVAPGLASRWGLDSVRTAVDEIVAGRGVATGLGLASLFWIGTTVTASLEQAINVAWRLDQRGFVRRRLLALAMLFGSYALLVLSFGLTATLSAVRTMDIRVFGELPSSWPWLWTLAAYFIPLVLSVGTFTLIYKVLPNTRVEWRVALAGGLFAGVAWELAKHAFSFYVSNFAYYSAIYGSLAGMILLLVWIYYSSIVAIMGAEVASVYAGRRNGIED